MIQKGLKKKGREDSAATQGEEANRPTYTSLPYVKGSEPIARVLKQHNIKTGHKSRTLRNHLVQVKDKVGPEMTKGAFYQIKCECGESYIGESGRPKAVRIKEHIADVKHGRIDTSATAQHTYSCNKNFKPRLAKTLAVKSNWKRRTVREALEIKVHRASMNRGVGKVTISPIWDIALT